MIINQDGKWVCDKCKKKFDYKFQAERCECWRDR